MTKYNYMQYSAHVVGYMVGAIFMMQSCGSGVNDVSSLHGNWPTCLGGVCDANHIQQNYGAFYFEESPSQNDGSVHALRAAQQYRIPFEGVAFRADEGVLIEGLDYVLPDAMVSRLGGLVVVLEIMDAKTLAVRLEGKAIQHRVCDSYSVGGGPIFLPAAFVTAPYDRAFGALSFTVSFGPNESWPGDHVSECEPITPGIPQ